MKKNSAIFPFIIALLMVGCDDPSIGDSTLLPEPEAGEEPPLPRQIGAFVILSDDWSRLTLYDSDPVFDGYPETVGLAPASFPVIRSGANILLNKIPVDPSKIRWTSNVMISNERQSRGRYMADTENGSWPALVTEVEPDVYSIDVDSDESGLHALVLRDGMFTSRAIFLNVE